jgi:hypothetical protein
LVVELSLPVWTIFGGSGEVLEDLYTNQVCETPAGGSILAADDGVATG